MAAAAYRPDPEFQALARAQYAHDPRALGALGARLVVGRDAPRSPPDGAALLTLAAEQDDAASWRVLAVLAAAGVARPRNWPAAYAALECAAGLGDAGAQADRAALAAMGLPDAKAALEWLSPPSMRALCESPHLAACRDFFPPALVSHLVQRARPRLVPAQVNDARGGGLKLDPMRTNTGAVFSLIESDLPIELARARIACAARVQIAALEPAEVLHYDVGERYKLHVDFFHPALPSFAAEMRAKGQRVTTCLVYLNDDFEGGETDFPKLGVRFRGAAGEALFFDNVGPGGTGDMRTLHEGLPPGRGEKWLFSQWIRSKPQMPA